nr:hypothetical protein B0A51_00972 [Rachicladosporium sp. CCFEE 5018]
MPVSSLALMAQRAAIRTLPRIEDVGDTPYELLEPILRRIDNPDHLLKIETNSPHIADKSAPLWQAFIIRDIPDGKKKMLFPKNPRSWHKVYRKLRKEEEAKKKSAEDTLQKTLLGLKEEKGSTMFVNKVIARPAKQAMFVDGVLNTRGNQHATGVSSSARPLQAIKRSVVARAQQQKPHMQIFAKTGIPSGKTQILVAPKSMLPDYNNEVTAAAKRAAEAIKRIAEPKTEIRQVFAPKGKKSATDTALDAARLQQMREREQRLRNLTQPGRKTMAEASSARVPTTTHTSTHAVTRAIPTVDSTPSKRDILTAKALSRPIPRYPVALPSPASTAADSPGTQYQLDRQQLPPSPPTTASSPGMSQGTGGRSLSPAVLSPRAGIQPKRKRQVDIFMPVKKGRV